MSVETLKFFEDKTTEEIINWMISNLSEDQIRSCLDQSGIPDTSVIQGSQPIAAAATGPSSIQTITLADGTQKQLQPGEGSSSDPLPLATTSRPEKPKKTPGEIFLEKYRKKCNGTGYLIKSVSKEGVEYYEFKEIDEDDTPVTLGVNLGDVGWVKKTVPISKFKVFCTEDDIQIFEILKEENQETFLGAPAEVIEVAAEYPEIGLPSPLPITTQTMDAAIEPTPVEPSSKKDDITEPMLKALKSQQKSSEIMRSTYNNLFSSGLTMYPIFVYASDGDLVLHLTPVVEDGKLTFIKDSTNKKLLNGKFKKITSAIQSTVEAGMYTPTDNIQEELNEALKSVSPDIQERIRKIYDPTRLEGYTYFGTLDDEPDWLTDAAQTLQDSRGTFDVASSQDLDMNDLPIQEGPVSTVQRSGLKVICGAKNKKVSDMTISEIEDHMRIHFGEQYIKDYKPEKYINSHGVTTVKYVKRPNNPSKDDTVLVSRPKFTEFQGKPSDADLSAFGYDDSEDLLFG